MDQARLIIDYPLDGPTNMAIDEAILTTVGHNQAPPTLRFYRWSVPTISLGHFQRFAEIDQLAPPFRGLPVVRRITGGGAILHDAELTYSLVLPADHGLAKDRNPKTLYLAVHEALLAVLFDLGLPACLRRGPAPKSQQAGPFFCFQRVNPSDVMVNGKKIAGSAQRRTLHSLLQHGSLMLGNPLQQPGVISLADYLQPAGRTDPPSLARAWADELAKALGLIFAPATLNQTERSLAEALREKYTGEAWTKRR